MAHRWREMMAGTPPTMVASVVAIALAAVILLAPALILTAGFLAWAYRQGWPSTRLRTPTGVLAGGLVAGVALHTVIAGPSAVPDAIGAAVTRAVDGQMSWSGSLGVFFWLELPIAAAFAWALLAAKERRLSQDVGLIRAQRFREFRRRAQQRAALRRARHELTPLSRQHRVILGHEYRREERGVKLAGDALTQRHPVWLDLTLARLNLHVTLTGRTGAGKTELIKRLTAGWTEAAWRRYVTRSSQGLAGSHGTAYRQAAPRPLTIFVDCKGGRDSAAAGAAWADSMEAVGLAPERVGIFPYTDTLDMWGLPAAQLIETLHELGQTDQKFYDALNRALLSLVLDMPGITPPRSSAEFLSRINPGLLRAEWQDHPQKIMQLMQMVAAKSMFSDLMLFDDLLRSLGSDFDGGRPLADFDALFVAIDGTSDARAAAVKAKLFVELLKYELTHGAKRDVLFVFDEWSAVSSKVSVQQLVQTARSMGGSVVLSAQSYSTLGADAAEVEQLVGVMGGGYLVMAGVEAEPWSNIAGTRERAEVGSQLDGAYGTGAGTVRLQNQYVISPDELKALPAYHVAHVEAGRVRLAKVEQVGDTSRRSARMIAASGLRELPTVGDSVSLTQRIADRQRVLKQAREVLDTGGGRDD